MKPQIRPSNLPLKIDPGRLLKPLETKIPYKKKPTPFIMEWVPVFHFQGLFFWSFRTMCLITNTMGATAGGAVTPRDSNRGE